MVKVATFEETVHKTNNVDEVIIMEDNVEGQLLGVEDKPHNLSTSWHLRAWMCQLTCNKCWILELQPLVISNIRSSRDLGSRILPRYSSVMQQWYLMVPNVQQKTDVGQLSFSQWRGIV